jgi:hypothetical protein
VTPNAFPSSVLAILVIKPYGQVKAALPIFNGSVVH